MEELIMNANEMRAPMDNTTVILKRTFNQDTYDENLKPNGSIKFWRVMAPKSHLNYGSDLSVDGLKQWGII